jgi:hypothetical protein
MNGGGVPGLTAINPGTRPAAMIGHECLRLDLA